MTGGWVMTCRDAARRVSERVGLEYTEGMVVKGKGFRITHLLFYNHKTKIHDTDKISKKFRNFASRFGFAFSD